MYKIEDSILATSTPAAVLAALTTNDGLRGWWTTEVDSDCAKHTATFRFGKQAGGESAHTFHLDAADERRVAMSCTESTNGDWLGTTLEFRIVADGTATRIELVHDGYAAKNELYDMCTKGWAFFLGSLKSYLETGKGEPHVRPKAA